YLTNAIAISLIGILVVAQLSGGLLSFVLSALPYGRNPFIEAVQRGSYGATAFVLAWGTLQGVFGGWLTAFVARRAPLQATIVLGIGLWGAFMTVGHRNT